MRSNNEEWPDPDAVVLDTVILEGSNYETGVAGTTAIHCRELSDKERAMDLKPGDRLRPRYEVRMGIAIFGGTNLTEEEADAIGNNPFHPQFYDNYVKGFGNTPEEAVAVMAADQKEICESLWAI